MMEVLRDVLPELIQQQEQQQQERGVRRPSSDLETSNEGEPSTRQMIDNLLASHDERYNELDALLAASFKRPNEIAHSGHDKVYQSTIDAAQGLEWETLLGRKTLFELLLARKQWMSEIDSSTES